MTAQVKARTRRIPDVSTVPARELAQVVRRVRRQVRGSTEYRHQLTKTLLNMAPVPVLVDVMRSTEIPDVFRTVYRSMTLEDRIFIVGTALHFAKRRRTTKDRAR